MSPKALHVNDKTFTTNFCVPFSLLVYNSFFEKSFSHFVPCCVTFDFPPSPQKKSKGSPLKLKNLKKPSIFVLDSSQKKPFWCTDYNAKKQSTLWWTILETNEILPSEGPKKLTLFTVFSGFFPPKKRSTMASFFCIWLSGSIHFV